MLTAGPPNIGTSTYWSCKFNGREKERVFLAGSATPFFPKDREQLSAQSKHFYLGLLTVLKPTQAEGPREPDSSLVKREFLSLRFWGEKGIYIHQEDQELLRALNPGTPALPTLPTSQTATASHSGSVAAALNSQERVVFLTLRLTL